MYIQCGSCQVYGFCTQTDAECEAYHEGFGWDRDREIPSCRSCSVSLCSQTASECDAYKEINGVGQVVFSDLNEKQNQIHTFPANRGLMNWYTGYITSITTGDLMALVTVKCEEQYFTSMLPLEKLQELQYKQGDTVSVAIKAVNVVLMR